MQMETNSCGTLTSAAGSVSDRCFHFLTIFPPWKQDQRAKLIYEQIILHNGSMPMDYDAIFISLPSLAFFPARYKLQC